MRVCLGGTFDPFHVGHERLLRRAIHAAGPDGKVFVGLVSDAFSAGKRPRRIRPFDERRATLEAWFAGERGQTEVILRALDDPHGPSVTGAYDVLVTSIETADAGARINTIRAEKGLPPLRVEVVPFALGDDLLPISGTRVAEGRIDRTGKRLAPLRVAVGSENPVKLRAVAAAFSRFLHGMQVEPIAVAVDPGVPAQPYGEETARGARNRAQAALAAVPEAEYGVGVEAGLVADGTCGGWLDVQHCVITDRSGYVTHGHGPGFHYPRVVEEELAAGETVGQVLGRLAGDPDIGRAQGAVGWLTKDRLDRARLTGPAVEAALVPRVRRALYDTGAASGH